MTAFNEAWDLLKGTPHFPKDVTRHTRTTCEHCGGAHETSWHDIGKQPEHLRPLSHNYQQDTKFNRGTYPHRSTSADLVREKNMDDPRYVMGGPFPESEGGWTRMQDPTTRSLLQRFAQRGAQNIATSKLPWSQRGGASMAHAPAAAARFVMGGPSQDAGGFPKSPELIRVGDGQVTQFDPSSKRNRRDFGGTTGMEPWDEELEDAYGVRRND